MKVNYVEPTAKLLWEIATQLDEADALEIRRSTGQEPAVALASSVDASAECWVGIAEDGTLMGVWGYVDNGYVSGVWGYYTPGARRKAKTLIKESRKIIRYINVTTRQPLYAVADRDNYRALDYLGALGFIISRTAIPHGPEGSDFVEVVYV